MANIVNGNIFGIRMYGEVTAKDMENFAEFMKSLENLKKSLVKMFNEQVAEMAMKQLLSNTRVELSQGEVENNEMWESLVEMGVVFKKEHKELSNRMMIE
jgi:hypothetical protein